MHYHSIDQVAAAYRSGATSPLELTREMLRRIDELDPCCHSYATVTTELALTTARRAEQELAAGRDRGPLHGVPVAVKDLCFTRGIPTMGGTGVLRDHVPDFNATVVQRLEAAGAVLLGKLNLTEGAMSGYHPDFDIPVNPWGSDRWSGASSSGSGVATAAGLCFASLGSDTGGSIRFPAAACGTAGLKPTWGRVSRFGVLALAESLDHVGPLARSVRDCALVLEALSGPDPQDPTASTEPKPEAPTHPPDSLAEVRIGLDERWVTEDVDPELARSVLESVRVLEGLGARILAVSVPPMDDLVSAWDALCSAEAVVAHSRTYPSRGDEYGPYFRDWLDLGASVTGAEYARAHQKRLLCTGYLEKIFSKVDILACPAMPDPPHLVTQDGLYGPMVPRSPRRQRFTVPFDYSGAPTVTLPCGFSSTRLPLSLQLAGRSMQERLLCGVGMAYQRETDWHTMHPDLD